MIFLEILDKITIGDPGSNLNCIPSSESRLFNEKGYRTDLTTLKRPMHIENSIGITNNKIIQNRRVTSENYVRNPNLRIRTIVKIKICFSTSYISR